MSRALRAAPITSKMIPRSPLIHASTISIRYRSLRYRRFGEVDPDQVVYEVDPFGNYRELEGGRGRRPRGDWWDLLYDRKVWVVVGGLGLFYVCNLHKAPYTGRLQFDWVPYWLEQLVGDMLYRLAMQQFGGLLALPGDPVYRPIQRVMNRLLTVAFENTKNEKQRNHLEQLEWQIHVIEGDYPPNAFIMPNGKIFVFRLILPICGDEDGLATVLLHELSHQLAHHSLEQLLKSPIYLLILAILFSITGLTQMNEFFIQMALRLPSLRTMELEADHIGCELMAKACFNVDKAVGFWERMMQMEQQLGGNDGGKFGEIFSDHPASERRVLQIKLWLPQLHQSMEDSGCYLYGGFKQVVKDVVKVG